MRGLLAAGVLLAAWGVSPVMANPRRAILWVLDGTRADRFHALLDAGRLPHIDRHVVRRGLRVDHATTVFPSTTGPTYAPFVTGLLPASSGITGLRWYDRQSGKSWVYAGRQFGAINEALDPAAKTLYELLPGRESASVFGFVDRGAERTSMPMLDMAMPKLRGQYLEMDRRLFDAFMDETLGSGAVPRFMFLSFHAPDSVGHSHGDRHEDYDKSLVAIDGYMGEMVERLKHQGLYESTWLAISADHGQTEVRERMSLAGHLAAKGLAVRDCIEREPGIHNARAAWRRDDFDVHVEVNGNAAVFFYLNPEGRDPGERVTADQARAFGSRKAGTVDLEAALLAAPATELVLSRRGPGAYRIASARGAAELDRSGEGTLAYRVVSGRDPLGYAELPAAAALVGGKPAPANEWFRATAASDFPDALYQVASFLESPRAPDLAVSAAPGWEPWTEGQVGLHGGLRKEHMLVPLLLGGPGVPVRRLARGRTVDLGATLAEILGVAFPGRIEGVPLPWRDGAGVGAGVLAGAGDPAERTVAAGVARYRELVTGIEGLAFEAGMDPELVPGLETRRKELAELATKLAKALAERLGAGSVRPLEDCLAYASRDPAGWFRSLALLDALLALKLPPPVRDKVAAVRDGRPFVTRAGELVDEWVDAVRRLEASERGLVNGMAFSRPELFPDRRSALDEDERLFELLQRVVPAATLNGDGEPMRRLAKAREARETSDRAEDLLTRIESLTRRQRRFRPGQ